MLNGAVTATATIRVKIKVWLGKHRHLIIPKVQVACLKPPVWLLGEGTVVDQGPRSTISAYLEPKRLVDHVDVRGTSDNSSCTVPDRRPTFVNRDRHISGPRSSLGRLTSGEQYAGAQLAHDSARQIFLRSQDASLCRISYLRALILIPFRVVVPLSTSLSRVGFLTRLLSFVWLRTQTRRISAASQLGSVRPATYCPCKYAHGDIRNANHMPCLHAQQQKQQPCQWLTVIRFPDASSAII